jgi:hypothetical protein
MSESRARGQALILDISEKQVERPASRVEGS